MVISLVGAKATKQEIKSMISTLEKVGRILQPLDLKVIFDELPKEVASDKEKLTRFLLLTAFLDQQAESPTARKTAVNIYKTFGDDLFYNPQQVLLRLDKLVPLKGEYKISPAIGRVLPRFGWFVLRVGGFLIYEMILNKNKLSDKLGRCKDPEEAINFLHSNPIVESILRDKAVRMYISWVGHPDLGIDVSRGKWRKTDFEMPVDGHVGKVFSRTGMVAEIIHEDRDRKNKRWNIIIASKMRPLIQELAESFNADCIMVDHGAFQIGFNCCPDNLEGIACDSCPKVSFCEIRDKIGCKGYCLLKDYCKRNLTWRAY